MGQFYVKWGVIVNQPSVAVPQKGVRLSCAKLTNRSPTMHNSVALLRKLCCLHTHTLLQNFFGRPASANCKCSCNFPKRVGPSNQVCCPARTIVLDNRLLVYSEAPAQASKIDTLFKLFLFVRPQVARVPCATAGLVNLEVAVSVGLVKVSMSSRKASVLAGLL